ncbi:hypothetical protein LINGRAPRIM_LOCUS3331 [Linum grandiflorum]
MELCDLVSLMSYFQLLLKVHGMGLHTRIQQKQLLKGI